MGVLGVVWDIGVVLASTAAAVVLPGAFLVRPFFSRSPSLPALLLVLGYICGYASFTLMADCLTRIAGTNFYTLLAGPPSVALLLGLILNRFSTSKDKPDRLRRVTLSAAQIVACAAFACLVIVQVAPVSVGDHIYWGVPYMDWTKHISVAHAVARNGSPPLNPSYAPFGDRYLFYYFGYYLFPGSLVRYLGVGAIPTVLTCATLTAASFTAVCVSLGNYLVGSLRGGWFALALCFVTGLDILPVTLLEANGRTFHDIEWWSPGQVTAITGFLVWVPQHTAASVDVLAVHLLLGALDTAGFSTWRDARLVPVIILTGACAMTSTYVAELLFGSLAVYGLFSILRPFPARNAGVRSLAILIAGSLIILPFYSHLLTIDCYQGPSQLPLFRPFAWEADGLRMSFFRWFDCFQPYFGSRQAYRLFTLPMQYLLEFGFWAIVGVWWAFWGQCDAERDPIMARLRVMSGCALLIGSVFVSVRENPDLNWRVLHPLQGVLTAVGAAFLLRSHTKERQPRFYLQCAVLALLYFGVLGTLYNYYNLRFSFRESPNPDPKLIGRACAAAPQIEALTAPTARVQYNPTHNPPWEIYLNRPFPISGSGPNSVIFGVSKTEHAVVLNDIASIFGLGLPPVTREQLIIRYQIDYLLVQKEDPIFELPLRDLFARPPPIVYTSGEWILLDTSALRLVPSPTRQKDNAG